MDSKRDRALDFLRRSLKVILETNRSEVIKAIDKAAKHAIVVKGRAEMFQAYDQFLENQCIEEVRLDGKKTSVKKGWKVLEEELFYLDKLDMHNACFTSGIVFPSIMYD